MRVPNGVVRRIALIIVVVAVTTALAVRTTPPASPHVSVVHDWSNHHIVYGNSDLETLALLARRDPRALSNWVHRNSHLLHTRQTGPYVRPTQNKNSRIDWAMSLG